MKTIFIYSITVVRARFMKYELNIIIYGLAIRSSTEKCGQSQET